MDVEGESVASALDAVEYPSVLFLIGLGVLTAVLFAGGLLVTEYPGEFVLDVDLKPFFIPYLIAAFVPFGYPTLAIGLGAAAGEGMLDVSEGYELDDPLGFIGYVIGFTVYGFILHEIADDPFDRRTQVAAAVGGAFVQAVFEGFAFFLFEREAVVDAMISVAGNTITHGIVLGAIPLVLLAPFVRTRVLGRL